jgi:molybdopterin-containing oxidoreductase family iron-sulfur binding subunit
MLIDTRKCVGCHACTIGCVAEYKLPPGVVYRPVIDKVSGKFPEVKRQFLPRPCYQCETPSCVPVCPVGATKKEADGIVSIDYEKCIGCRSCIANCPYGARTFDAGTYYTEDLPALQEYEKAGFSSTARYGGGAASMATFPAAPANATSAPAVCRKVCFRSAPPPVSAGHLFW